MAFTKEGSETEWKESVRGKNQLGTCHVIYIIHTSKTI